MNRIRIHALLLLALLGIPGGVRSQSASGTLRLQICDSTSREPVNGTVVTLCRLADSTIFHAVSLDRGEARFTQLRYGDYALETSFLGYEPLRRRLRIDRPLVEPDTLRLSPSSTRIEEVVLTVPALRSTQNGDTLSYHANAYKVALGANSESLVAKMPGIAVSDRGIEALGRNVRKVTVDGQEFFNDDVLSALKNIPADMVEDIEVFNKLSDQAEQTGVDDGQGYTTLNIVTRADRRRGLFGRLYGLYGLPDKYVGGGSLSRFGEKGRLTLTALANNVSLYNFVNEDLVGAASSATQTGDFSVKPLAGLSTVHSFGVNYNNDWFSGSYFFNRIDNANRSLSDRENLSTGRKTLLTASQSDYDALNFNHRFAAKMNFNAGRHNFIIRPSLNLQDQSDHRTQTNLAQNRIDGEEELRYLHRRLIGSRSDRWGLNLSNSFNYRYRFLRPGRSLALSLYANYYDNRNDGGSDQYTFRDPDAPLLPDAASARSAQQSERSSSKVTARAGLTYTEPFGKRLRMSWEYSFAYSHDEADKQVWLLDKASGTLLPEPDARQSSTNEGSYLTHRIGPRLQYTLRSTTLTAGAAFQAVRFDGRSVRPAAADTRKRFENVTYNVVANLTIDPRNTLRLDASGRTTNPSVSALQNVVNLANLSNITAGNPDLDPTYLHSLNLRYIRTNPARGRTFSLTAGYDASANYIGDSVVVDQPGYVVAEGVELGEGDRFVRPANLGGYRRFQGRIGFGFPVDWLRSNLNLYARVTLSRQPSLINGVQTPIHRNTYQLGLSLSSNISENLDFSCTYTGQYTQAEFSSKAGTVHNDFFTQTASGEIKWAFWRGFTFTGSVAFQQNAGISDDFDDRRLSCNLYLGKRIFRNRLGEVSVGVNDLFDDNGRRYYHSINATGSTNIVNQGVGRYFAVQFVYHLRAYRNGKR